MKRLSVGPLGTTQSKLILGANPFTTARWIVLWLEDNVEPLVAIFVHVSVSSTTLQWATFTVPHPLSRNNAILSVTDAEWVAYPCVVQIGPDCWVWIVCFNRLVFEGLVGTRLASSNNSILSLTLAVQRLLKSCIGFVCHSTQ